MRLINPTLRVAMAALLTLCLGASAYAAFQGPGANGYGGGFQGSNHGNVNVTVRQAKNMPDDSIVTLTGNVVAKISGTKDKYRFRDNSGEMVIEIDHKYFRGQTVTPANTVRITGEVDKDFGRAAEVDVKMLEVLK